MLPEQAIDLPTALRAYTLGSARALGLDEETGSITVGKSADLVVLDGDIERVSVNRLGKVPGAPHPARRDAGLRTHGGPAPVISAAGLSRSFNGRPAVQDVSFELPPGSLLALLGPNGAGKTTTIRLLLGLIKPTAGTAIVAGIPLSGDERRDEAPGLVRIPDRSARVL